MFSRLGQKKKEERLFLWIVAFMHENGSPQHSASGLSSRQATKTYGKNKIMTKLLDQMSFYVLPVFTIDGYIWSWTQNRMWRKIVLRIKTPNASALTSIGTLMPHGTAKVAKIGTDVLSTRYESHYIYGPIATTIYPTSGSSLDWAYNLGIKHTFAFELRDKGKFGFLLPESRIKSTCKETMLAVQFIAKYILRHTS
ncbi:Mast cell carboxypeptidase A [Manis javanica]|nr:Mast cell carboxypeptidase A [Manis javanica]